MLAPSQWKTSLHSNAVSHWLGANLESTLQYIWQAIFHQKSKYQPDKSISTFSSYYRSAIGKTLLNVLNVLNWHPVIWSIYCKPLENRHPLKICWHDDVIKWKHFPRYWPFVRRIHRSTVNSLHKGQWRGAMMFSLICDWNGFLKISLFVCKNRTGLVAFYPCVDPMGLLPKLRVAHAPGMPGTFSPTPTSKETAS